MSTQVDETSRTQTHGHRHDDLHEHRHDDLHEHRHDGPHEHRHEYWHDQHDRRSIRELLKMLRDETTALFRYQAMLAKAETIEKTHIAGRNSITIAIGGALLLTGLVFLLLALRDGLMVWLFTIGVDPSVTMWLSPLMIGVITAGIGGVLAKKGLSTLKRETWMPERTIHTIQDDEEWLKEKIH